jgi:isopentenyl diphosphate isomerase/L-lactate dehydrogenase-like FMN-dependent dehydrogenase
MGALLSVEDYHVLARRKVPSIVLDYVDGGAETEFTVGENRRAFEAVTLRPRGGVDPSGVDTTVTVLGNELSTPILLAPCGMARVVHPGGDLAGARAAARAGTIFIQSTMSGHSVEEVVAGAGGAPVWYQAYRVGTQDQAAHAIERARNAGAQALVVTFDSAVGSLRERDRRSGGLSMLGRSRLKAARHLPKLLRTPGWFAAHLRDGMRPKLMNVVGDDGVPAILGRGPTPAGLSWTDLKWIRELWDGPIVLKGLLTAEDAVRAVDEGAAAIVVSNHGGRQLDTAAATLRVLPGIADAVAGRCEILLDGGVRSGIDALKALSLGARAVLVGRPWLYGLAVGGQSGIESVEQILTAGVRRNMALLGCKKLDELGRQFVYAPNEWFVS